MAIFDDHLRQAAMQHILAVFAGTEAVLLPFWCIWVTWKLHVIHEDMFTLDEQYEAADAVVPKDSNA